MQTILGANGVIGRELALSLPQYTERVRLVSRNPKKVNERDELLAADLTNAEQTMKAVEGSEVVYLSVGLPYNTTTWVAQWRLGGEKPCTGCAARCADPAHYQRCWRTSCSMPLLS